MKRITILGSTGSIGRSTLDVIANNRNDFRVVALSAGRNIKLFEKQIIAFKPEVVAVADEKIADALRRKVKKIIPLVVAAALGVGFATAAEAHVSVGIGIGIPVAPAYPVYAAPPPVYYAPPPVYAPPVVVVGGGYGGYYGYRGGPYYHRGYYGHGYYGHGYGHGYYRR